MKKKRTKSLRQQFRDIRKKEEWLKWIRAGSVMIMLAAAGAMIIIGIRDYRDKEAMNAMRNKLKQAGMETNAVVPEEKELSNAKISPSPEPVRDMKKWYQEIWEHNNDFVGWLTIPDTRIDYPVMQRPEDEDYYLTRGFDEANNKNGSLFADTDCQIGRGTKEEYVIQPSGHIIIHGHSRKSGEMFGGLLRYAEESYTREHSVIYLDTAYERRTYEVIAVFQSQIYKQREEAFKYYNYFEFMEEKDFTYFYDNIKAMSFFDTGVTAEFGDEFISLSTCSYLVDNTRFVVMAKRIK